MVFGPFLAYFHSKPALLPEAFATVRRLAATEGVLCGGSSGAAAAGARRIAERLGPGRRVVTLFPDGAERYLSQGIFD